MTRQRITIRWAIHLSSLLAAIAVWMHLALPCVAQEKAAAEAGILPTGRDGRSLNTDFESGDLSDWTATGNAFDKQPIEGDVVARRRNDMRSGHAGRFWIGGYEVVQDAGRGTLTSAPFKVTLPWAAFRCAGGGYDNCRVELVRADNNEVVFRTTVFEPDAFQETTNANETMRPCVVDLSAQLGKEIFIRVVDDQVGHWAHLNFDDFKLYAARPEFKNEFKAVSRGLKQLGPATAAPTDQYTNAGLSPEEAAKAMTVPEGFTVTLFAGEPDVQQPIAMAIDDRGRLWIAEAYAYPVRVPEGQARDRIIILEDTNGDGRFDKRTVFADKLNLVSGLEIGFGGVWVGSAPQFLFIPDQDGDDQPDGPPQVLLEGWGYQDTHETLNSFIWGPDGWLYGCHGVFTHSRVGKPGTPDAQRIPINAGIWRYHPTKHVFEVFAHGTSNPWGVDFNDRGQAFLTACVIPHLYHVIQGGRYQRQAGQHFNPYTFDDIKTIAKHRHWVGASPHGGNGRSDSAGGGHAHAGAMIYLGGTWPDKYRGQIFMNNIHGARLNQDALAASGSGYVGDRAPDFLLANDAWSQILYLTYGPDGNVFLIDWYDKNQCHHGNVPGHDRSNGRVFKVSWQGAGSQASRAESKLPAGGLAKLSDVQLVERLSSRNDWDVRHARRLLQERAAQSPAAAKNETVVSALAKLAFEATDETRRLRGLWSLHVMGTLNEELLQRGLTNDSPFVRAWSIQLACDAAAADEMLLPDGIRRATPSGALLRSFERLAKEDRSPVVRLYLASAAQRLTLVDRAGILSELVRHAEDSADHNLPLMIWYAAEPLASSGADGAFRVLSNARIPQVRGFLTRRLSQSDDAGVLAKLVEAALGTATDVVDQRLLLGEINEGLKGRRQVAMPATWPAVFAKLSTSSDADVRSQAMTVALTFGDPRAIEIRRKELVDPNAPLPARAAALESLTKINAPNLAPALQSLLSDPALAAAALRALASYDDPQTAASILKVYTKLGTNERRDALNTLASREAYASELFAAIARKDIAAADLSADIVRQLRNLKSKSIDEQITKFWGTFNDTPEEKAKLIAHWKGVLSAPAKTKTKPDLAAGRAIFAKTCQQCHVLFGAGSKVGPELTGSNRANLDYVLSNILDPSALIGKDYQAQVITTTAGRVLTGLVKAEDDKSVTLVTANETVVLPKDEIDERAVSSKSMMPDDILKPLTEGDVRSLVAYLASPNQTPLLATAETSKLFFNGRDLTGWSGNLDLWHVEDGEIVGRTTGLKQNEFLKSDLLARDFRLTLEVKLVKNEGNSGIQFRSEALSNGDVKGYQADIGQGWWGKLYEEHGRALLWDKSGEAHVKRGDWNAYEVVAVGARVRTSINAQLCVDLDDPAGARGGVFAFQLHSGGATEVRYRNLRLDVLDADAAAVKSP